MKRMTRRKERVQRARKPTLGRHVGSRHSIRRLLGRLLVATLLGDSAAGRMLVMFPRMRMRRVAAMWLIATLLRSTRFIRIDRRRTLAGQP